MHVLMIGMGRMGSALADALLQANFDVSVWNRTPERCRSAIDAGAAHVDTVAEGARQCDVVISCLADHQAVHDTVITSEVARALADKTLVQLSQATPEQSIEYAAWAERHGVGYLDGSILGYPKDVRAGDCDIIYSGASAVFESCRSVLQAMGSRPRLVGDRPGIAPSFDKAFFAFYYSHVLGLLHGAAICHAAGIPIDAYLDLMVDNWTWKPVDGVIADVLRCGDYTVRESSLDTHAHAYNQVAPYCRKVGVDARLADAIDAVLKAGIDSGHGPHEIASLIETLGRVDRSP